MTRKFLCAAAIVAAASFAAEPVAATGPEGLFGAGADAIGRGGAFTGVADDFSAVFYNPAGLTQLPGTQISFGILTSYPDLSINGERLDHERARGGYLGFGAPIFHGRAAIGAMIYLPQNLLIDASAMSPEIPQAVLLQENRTQILSAYFGGAFEVVPDKLSLGAGLQIVPAQSANSDLFLSAYFDFEGLPSATMTYNDALGEGDCNDPSRVLPSPIDGLSPDRTFRNCRSYAQLEVDAATRVSPVFGLLWTPNDRLSVGLSFRHESSFDLDVGVNSSLETIASFDLSTDTRSILSQTPSLRGSLSGRSFFSPNELTLGIAARPTQAIGLSFDLVWADWSKYVDPRSEAEFKRVRTTFETPSGTALFPEKFLRVDYRTFKRPKFRDVIIPRIGMEYTVPGTEPFLFVGDVDFNFRFGYAYEKSPVRDNQGSAPVTRTRGDTTRLFNTGTNLLDANKHIFSLGLGIESRRPFKSNLEQYIPEDYKHIRRVSIPRVRFQSLDFSYQHIILGGNSVSYQSRRPVFDHRPASSLKLDGSIQTGAFNMTLAFD